MCGSYSYEYDYELDFSLLAASVRNIAKQAVAHHTFMASLVMGLCGQMGSFASH